MNPSSRYRYGHGPFRDRSPRAIAEGKIVFGTRRTKFPYFLLFSRFKLARYTRTRAWEHNTTYDPPACAFTFSPLHKKYPVRVICKSKCIAFVPRSYIIVVAYNAQYQSYANVYKSARAPSSSLSVRPRLGEMMTKR